MDLELHQVELRYAALRRRDVKRERPLLASLTDVGQQSPVVVVREASGSWVLVDGYKRVRALKRLHRDTVAAVEWALTEVEALLLTRLMRTAEGDSALEQGWLLRELHERFALSCGELARRLRGATLSYQALTGYCRRHGIGFEPPKPAGRYVFEPGQEMQHDTSPHVMSIGGVERRVQTASVVLAYSRMRFMQVYPSFNRFTCKVFLDEAVSFFGGACSRCMVDNTHVIVLKGTGANMVPVPEMEAFGERYGFTFVAHEKGDANRSAHVERGFDHIERNFIPGRAFTDFAHANREAREWCARIEIPLSIETRFWPKRERCSPLASPSAPNRTIHPLRLGAHRYRPARW